MTLRGPLLAMCLGLLAAAPVCAQDKAPRSARRAPTPAPASGLSSEDRQLLHQLSDAQRWVNDQLQQVKDRADGLYAELAKRADEHAAEEEEVKAMRDEVKGLYVEISGVKQQIDALKENVDGVNSNISGFRTFSGFFIAAMILLLAVIFVMTIRR